MKHFIGIAMLGLSFTLHAQTVIDISVKGISNAGKDGAQKDRMEAIPDAKKTGV
ncbi:MAG: hypothetical protein JW913_19255 [Chitinispirillaceae bacterium]|nr:hypothetical protein [Chitinispirillaceae bacterium]